MNIFIGSDHRGFKLKEKLIDWLEKNNYSPEDMGAYKYDKDDDYTLYAEKVALMVRDKRRSKGILLCGSGVGVDVVANKFDGIRASIGKDVDQVKSGRRDDDMNVLVIAADHTSSKDAIEMVKAFLKTKFDGKKRHRRRLQEIERIEENN
ncbi:MAG: RpiB/LacA/LacB family sugar-phosphate isomerase [Candidatus Woesebacteria bacterium]|jgi:ribose 5-phosphate isomerase B